MNAPVEPLADLGPLALAARKAARRLARAGSAPKDAALLAAARLIRARMAAILEAFSFSAAAAASSLSCTALSAASSSASSFALSATSTSRGCARLNTYEAASLGTTLTKHGSTFR